MTAQTWTDLLGPFNSKASNCGCVILLEDEVKPTHFKVLWKFDSFEKCEAAFEVWKNEKKS
jgi:hypothetical protein